LNAPDRDYTILTKNEILSNSLINDLDIDLLIMKKRDSFYSKAKLWNLGTSLSKYEHLIFLDDDHPFSNRKSLEMYKNYFQDYKFIVGRLQDPSGLYRLYRHFTVQGTNFGIEKQLLIDVGGFGEYTSQWGMGEDSDIFFKIFQYAQKNPNTPLACYAGNIITKDLASGRWKKCEGSEEIYLQGFHKLFGVSDDIISNKSRDKKIWIKHTSKHEQLSELFFEILNVFFRFRILIRSPFLLKKGMQDLKLKIIRKYYSR